jgi:hypothetical protein
MNNGNEKINYETGETVFQDKSSELNLKGSYIYEFHQLTFRM